MRWVEQYTAKRLPADRALASIRSGERVYVHPGAAVPESLLSALVARAADLRDVEIVHLLTLGEAPYVAPEFSGHFRHNALFAGRNVREAVNAGRADFTPVFLSEIPSLFSSGKLPLDAALIQVSPPDEHGFVSLGVGTDCTMAAARAARRVIAEVNPEMPRVLGDNFLHLSRLSALVETRHQLPELPRLRMSEEHRAIGRHVAELIEDGATLQMGIGGIPDAVLYFMQEKNDLGVHTEMFSDGIIELAERGVINGSRKTLHPGKIVASFMFGTKELYRFVNDNPIIEVHPTEYVNDPFIISQNERMIAINSAIQIDLTGQVAADSIGFEIYSGIGGQVDFFRGAARSRGGKPILALPSTARNGTISRIVAVLDEGASVVTSRGDVHWVVTEYGAVNLHGTSLRRRAEMLISIAHPDFREALAAEARGKRSLALRAQTS
jgi:4-hydroxybutyrate CoA-transferase